MANTVENLVLKLSEYENKNNITNEFSLDRASNYFRCMSQNVFISV